jgi:hypothetical protein
MGSYLKSLSQSRKPPFENMTTLPQAHAIDFCTSYQSYELMSSYDNYLNYLQHTSSVRKYTNTEEIKCPIFLNKVLHEASGINSNHNSNYSFWKQKYMTNRRRISPKYYAIV